MTELSWADVGFMVAGYSDRAGSRLDEYDESMRAQALESDLVMGFALFLLINILDTNRRAAVCGDQAAGEPAEGRLVEDMLREWSRSSSAIMPRIGAMEAAGHSVKWSEWFRRAYREAQAMLTPDA
jgi:hypothetical protein